MSMRWLLTGLLISLMAVDTAAAVERTLGVRQPPETVFDVPVETILPALEDATPTGENGRVGGELVFWGYRLENGREAYLFACALLEGVNCEERIDAICANGTTVLERLEHGGLIVQRRCRGVRFAAPGDLHPGCVSATSSSDLSVGLVSCN